MGMDSLMAVRMKSRLEAITKSSLPTTLTFDYPNVQALTAYLAGCLPGADTPEPPASSEFRQNVGDIADLLDKVEKLSDGEVDRVLHSRTDKGGLPDE
jgi:hypothetical protein